MIKFVLSEVKAGTYKFMCIEEINVKIQYMRTLSLF
jgi:hypothetical protein